MAGLKAELIQQLELIPEVTHRPWPERVDGFSTLHFKGKEIGHFHNFNELDLRLGQRLIKAEGLEHPADSKQHPNRSKNSPHIEIRFTKSSDLKHIVRLVNLLVAGP
tara:strand:+ start:38945 stop:39265 length:321 start_codon:yes stop_codon:yes gene_type:complete